MKVEEVKCSKFVPVMIKLETEEELQMLYAWLMVSNDECPKDSDGVIDIGVVKVDNFIDSLVGEMDQFV